MHLEIYSGSTAYIGLNLNYYPYLPCFPINHLYYYLSSFYCFLDFKKNCQLSSVLHLSQCICIYHLNFFPKCNNL